ncbi:MAG: VanZ family protein [Gemmatimonadaceae bacterium]
MQHKRAGRILAAAGLGLILVATLVPLPSSNPGTIAWCVICGEFGVADFALNVTLFVPFAAGVRLMGFSPLASVGIAALMTVGIETLQMNFITGRDASLGDLLANLVGGGIGIAAASTWRIWLFPSARAAAILAWSGSIAWLIMLTGTAWALHRSLDFSTYAGRWAPQSHYSYGYHGLVLSATLNGKPLINNSIRNSTAMRADLLSERVQVEADVVPGPAPEGLVAIASVGVLGSKIVLLGQKDEDLVFRIRTRASDVQLRTPAVKLSRAFEHGDNGASNLLVRIKGISTSDRLIAELESGGATLRQELRLTPNLAWTFFLPLDVALGWSAIIVTWLWIAALLVPVAYWAARSRENGFVRVNVPVLLAVLCGFLAVPALFGVASVAASEWMAAAAGIALGNVAGLHSRKKTLQP